MQSSSAHKLAPVFSDDRKIDVSVENGEAIVRLSMWTDGLGWCTQKTMSLDADMLDDLHRVIAAARLKVKRTKNDEDGSTVLRFPSIS